MTDDGTDGSSRDQRTRTSPTLARYNRWPWKANPLRVSRRDWRPCLRRGRMPDPAALALTGQGIEPVPVGAPGVVGGLHQRHRRGLGQPRPLRGALGHGDHPPLHLTVTDPLPGGAAFLAQPQAVVEHHPGAPERPRQRLPLARRGIDPVPVPDLHSTTVCHRPMTNQQGLPPRQARGFRPARPPGLGGQTPARRPECGDAGSLPDGHAEGLRRLRCQTAPVPPGRRPRAPACRTPAEGGPSRRW